MSPIPSKLFSTAAAARTTTVVRRTRKNMAKNAAKKRRSGTRKVVKKLKNTFRYKKPEIGSAVVRELWDNNLTAETNMAKMGLRQSANSDVRPLAIKAAVKATPGGKLMQGCDVARMFDVADTDDLKMVDRNFGRRPMSDEDQRYTVKLMAKYGLDHEAMARDIKINYNQITLGKLRRMCDTLLSLADDQRVVTIPARALKEAPPSAAGGGDGASGAADAAREGPISGVKDNKKKKKKTSMKKKERGE